MSTLIGKIKKKCFLWQLLGWEIATDQGYNNCRVGETDTQEVYIVFPDHTNGYAAEVQVWVSCMIGSCLWQLLGWETATDVGWSHWFFIKNFLVAEYEWEAICVSLLWTLKDILEYVFWRGALVAVSFVCSIACKDMIINLTNSLSHKLRCCWYWV